ncbi:MAG: hypothetical protein AAFX50_03825, partial [Acidobacteriota bacterium]
SYKPTVAPAPSPFALDFEITGEGLHGAIGIVGDVTLKRGVIGSTSDGGASAAYFVTVTRETTTASSTGGNLSLRLAQQPAPASAADEPFLAEVRVNPQDTSDGREAVDMLEFDLFDRGISGVGELYSLGAEAPKRSRNTDGL